MIRIGAFKGTGFLSKLIKWRTGGEYSHIGLCLDLQYWVEAEYGRGVCKTLYPPSKTGIEVDIYKADFKDEHTARKFLLKQIGKAYDLKAVLNIATCNKEDRSLSNKWMCSELAYVTLVKGGVHVFNNTFAWEVDPNTLTRSPALTYMETIRVEEKPFVF